MVGSIILAIGLVVIFKIFGLFQEFSVKLEYLSETFGFATVAVNLFVCPLFWSVSGISNDCWEGGWPSHKIQIPNLIKFWHIWSFTCIQNQQHLRTLWIWRPFFSKIKHRLVRKTTFGGFIQEFLPLFYVHIAILRNSRFHFSFVYIINRKIRLEPNVKPEAWN